MFQGENLNQHFRTMPKCSILSMIFPQFCRYSQDSCVPEQSRLGDLYNQVQNLFGFKSSATAVAAFGVCRLRNRGEWLGWIDA